MRFSLKASAALTITVGTLLAPAATAHAAVTTHNSSDVGLFGAGDPTYDGAFRQSLGLLAEAAGGVHDTAAIAWLVNQQCPDGGWTSYRADLSQPCPKTDLNAFTGEDSNSTALAVQALHALGVTPKYDAITFLHSLQDSDGGFPLLAGSGTDPNSTALVVQAIDVIGQDPTSAAWTVGGKTPMDALMASWLGCGSPDPGAFSSPFSSGHGDLVASVQAVWGAEQKSFPFTSSSTATKPALDCTGNPPTPTPTQAGQDAATWLAGKLTTSGYLTTGSSPDYSLTAQGALAMLASGTNSSGSTSALNYLATNIKAAVLDTHGNISPGALGYIALAAHAAGRSMTSFGGLDLLTELTSVRRALPTTVTHKPATKPATHPVTVPIAKPSAQHTSQLPLTGTAAATEAGIAGDCIVAGMVLLLLGRRRRAAKP